MQDIYTNGTYLQNNPYWHEEDASFKADEIAAIVKRNSIDPNSVAEVGCGTGEILHCLHKKWSKVLFFYGFDISSTAIERAKKKENGTLTFYEEDFANSNRNECFDLVLVIDVIEHIENYFSFLRGIVSKGKHTVFHIPLDMSFRTIMNEKILIESKSRVGHIHNFTEDFIVRVLADCGFETIDLHYTAPLYETKNLRQKIFKFLQMQCFKISPRICSKIFGGCSVLLLTKNKIALP